MAHTIPWLWWWCCWWWCFCYLAIAIAQPQDYDPDYDKFAKQRISLGELRDFDPIALPNMLQLYYKVSNDGDMVMPDAKMDPVLERLPALNMTFSDGASLEDRKLVAEACYGNGDLVFCVHAINITTSIRAAITRPNVSLDSQSLSPYAVRNTNAQDCLEGLRRAEAYDRCWDYKIIDAYYDWFLLRCYMSYTCKDINCRDYWNRGGIYTYRYFSDYTCAPTASLVVKTNSDLPWFRERCRRSEVYRRTTFTCQYAPSREECQQLDELDRPTTTTSTTTVKPSTTVKPPPPSNPEDPDVCGNIVDCNKAVGIESNLLPNTCDCHRFWQCQPLNKPTSTERWQLVPKICPKRNAAGKLQYFNERLKVCVNDRTNVAGFCED